jgi:molecular chaperone DnaK
VLLAGGMTRMPSVQAKVAQIFGRRPEHTINPDEIVAIGAAAHCGILTGELEGVTLFDVTPHSMGVKVMDDEMRFLIMKNASVPTSEERSFTTTFDYQDEVRIEVFQGESSKTSENTSLGEFVLKDLPRQKRGELEIVVTFLIDADGILQVSAREKASGREATIEIAASGGLSDEALAGLKRAHSHG